MLPPQPEHTNIPFSAEPDTFDQHLIQLGVLPVSPHRLMDALAQDGLNIKSLSVPSHLSESIPQEYIYVVSKLRFEAYRAIWIMRYCDFWYRKRFEFLCPAQANIYIQHKRSVQLLLGWDDFNTPIRASPSPADPKLPQDLIFLRTDRCTYATYFQFHHTTVWNTRLGVYYARYYRYLVVAKHILERDPLPSGVSEKLDTWWQGEFLAEMKKWLDASQKVLFAPSYDAAVNELATTSPIHLNPPPLNSNIKNVLNPNNQTPPLRLPHHHNIHTLPPGTLEPLPPPRDDNSRGNPSPRLYTLMACLEGLDSGIEFDCLDVEDDQHDEDNGVEDVGFGYHGRVDVEAGFEDIDDDDDDGCLGDETGSVGSEGVWYEDGEGLEGDEDEEEEYIEEEEESEEEELVVLRCDLSRVCDSIASSRVCHGTGLVGREKRRFGRGRVRGPRRRNTADEEAMEMDMAMARARVEDERISISTFSST
ncbi:hypothetical protein CBS115988_34 [Aspergillus niger]|nr:hypothetical protein CBS115988_34 [Aspergillus niger]